MRPNLIITISLFALIFVCFSSCKEKQPEEWCELEVTATAYNSSKWQTDGDPYIAAWGDTLKVHVKSIAVSNDLYRLGLKRFTKVQIEGLDGVYVVNDKMHSKWKNRIDIYFGDDIKAAREWGRRKVTIQYLLEH